MAARFTSAEIAQIVSLKQGGKTYKEIALTLNRYTKSGLPNERSVMAQYKKALPPLSTKAPASAPSITPVKPSPIQTEDEVQISEMSRRQRVDYLRTKLPAMQRGRFYYTEIFEPDERLMFEEEYFRILAEEDSMTNVEEMQLFMAVVHYVMAARAAKRDKVCYDNSPLAGTGKTGIYTDQHTREYHEQTKKYNDAMKGLKMSREQRLKDMQRHGTTFLDFAEKLAKTDEQALVIDEILKLESATVKDFERLQANGWLIGGGLPNNNDCEYYAKDEEPEEEEIK